jgi:DNA-binding Xre family transcriptional regulator
MNLKMRYDWRLRELMAEREMWKTTDLSPLLAERGITMSSAQIHRLVTTKPVRLSLDLLAALCDIFDCEPGALINIAVADTAQRRAAGGEQFGEWTDRRPRRPPPVDLGPSG